MEKQLQYLADQLAQAWKNNQCLTCPIGELAALAQATLAFYRETHGTTHAPGERVT